MQHDDPRTPQSLRALCQQAGEQAAGWHPGTLTGASARASVPAPLDRKRLLKIGWVGGLGLLGLAVVAAQFRSPAASVAAAAAAATATALPVAPLSTPLPLAVAAVPPEPVRWQGGELVIDFDQVPLTQAITLLAHATHTVVAGIELLQRPASVTLHWRFSDGAAAWRHLLQSHAGYGIRCDASICRVWITSEIAAPAAAPTPGAAGTPPGAVTVPADTAPSELEMSQPGGSC